MATAVTPELEQLLQNLEQRGGAGPSQALPPETEAKLKELEAGAKRLQPPPRVIHLQAPAPTDQGPAGAPLPAEPPVPPPTASGTAPGGSAFVLGPEGPGEREAALGIARGVGHVYESAPVQWTLRALAWAANPLMAAENSVAHNLGLGYKQGGLSGAMREAFTGLPGTLQAAEQGAITPGLVAPEVFGREGIDLPIPAKYKPYVEGGLNLTQALLTDPAAARLGRPLTRGLFSLVGKGAQKAGALDTVIPGINRSLNDLKNEAVLTRKSQRLLSRAEGQAGQIKEAGDQGVQANIRTMRELSKAGIDLKGMSPDGARTINRIDEAVFEYIRAGSPGAKFGSRADVLADAARYGTTPAQVAAIQAAVPKMAQHYIDAWKAVGQRLENIGYLKPGTVAKFGDTYAARMYHSTSHNVSDVEDWLSFANAHGAVNPEALRAAEELIGNVSQRGGGVAPSVARKDLTYAQQVGRGLETQATPVFAKSLQRETNVLARLHGIRDIEADPQLARAAVGPRGQQLPNPGNWKLADKRFGFQQPTYLHPAVHQFLAASLVPDEAQGAMKWVAGLSSLFKRGIMTGNVPAVIHKAKFDYVLSEGQAAFHGQVFTPVDVGKAARALSDYRKSGRLSPAIAALRNETHAFTLRGSSLADLGESLQGTIGIGGKNDALVSGLKKLTEATRKGIGRTEMTFKIALTEKLAPKLGYAEAARVAQETISGEHLSQTQINGVIKNMEKYGGVPFISARSKALPKMAAIALNSPNIFLRHARLSQVSGQIGGRQVQQRQQLAEEPLSSIYLPGMTDELGRPRFLTRDPFEIDPLGDLATPLSGVGGPLVAAGSALANIDIPRALSGRGASPIVRPGEIPPLEDVARRWDWFQQRIAPPLFPGTGHGALRIQRGYQGTTAYGGPFQQPEGLIESILGALTGSRITTPGTPSERLTLGIKHLKEHEADLKFATDYMGAVNRGEVAPVKSPWLEQARTPALVKSYYTNAYTRLRDLVTGTEGTVDERRQKIRSQVDWLMALQRRYFELSKEELTIDALLAPDAGP